MRKTEKNKMSFEDALLRLEEAANALESGDLPLAELLKTFEDGMEYVEICQDRLQKAEAEWIKCCRKNKIRSLRCRLYWRKKAMFKAYCKAKLPLIDEALQKAMSIEGEIAPTIFDSMRYSLFAGGKRLRPVLLLAAADAVGADGNKFLNVACGLEMIHTYSLIHDDLPAMDNDDYRRGKLTNHKVYGDGIAVLAGDSLLTYAFETMLSQEGVEPKTLLTVVKEIASAAGPEGMVGGQVIDMESEGKAVSLDTLQQMHRAKTGALFRAAVRAGAILGGASEKEVEALTVYAEKFGLAFQITDDILDVIGSAEAIGKPVGSDLKNNKSTYVTLHSVEIAQQLARETVADAVEALAMFKERGAVLKDLVEYLLKRES